MGYAIGTITKASGNDCHNQMLGVIKTLAEANGWETLRYISTGTNWELILKSVGLSGTEEIFIGFQCYQSVSGDYYNINCGVFIGYIAANTFAAQPGAYIYSVPAHNNAITYFITANAQRITGCFKVGTPVYMHFYAGKFFPYARPGEYPSPLVIGGMLDANAQTRFDYINMAFPYPGYFYRPTMSYQPPAMSKLRNRDQSGNWLQPSCYPFTQNDYTDFALAGFQNLNTLVPAGMYYQLEPIIMQQQTNDVKPSNVWGELDGIYFCSGFNNGVENVVQIGGNSTVDQTKMTAVKQAVDAIIAVNGRAFVMLQNVYRTSWRDFIAMEMK